MWRSALASAETGVICLDLVLNRAHPQKTVSTIPALQTDETSRRQYLRSMCKYVSKWIKKKMPSLRTLHYTTNMSMETYLYGLVATRRIGMHLQYCTALPWGLASGKLRSRIEAIAERLVEMIDDCS